MIFANNSINTKKMKKNEILYFFIRLLILVSIWFVVYTLILRPGRTIDRPVTNFITSAVTKAINLTSVNNEQLDWREDYLNHDRNFLIKNGVDIFGIYDVCNGIDLMFIYVGIIVLLPASYKRKFTFSVFGILVIILANIIRVYALYYIYFYYRPAFEISHHYIFTILIYILIFYGWLLFIKPNKINEKSS